MAKESSLDDLLKEYEADSTWNKKSTAKKPHALQEASNPPKKEAPTEDNRRLPPLKDLDKSEIIAVFDAIANLDPATAFDEFGAILPLDDMPLSTRVCIKSIKVKEVYEDKIKVGEIKDVQFWDKMSASEALGKYKKMFNDQPVQQTNNILIVDSLKRGLERLQEVGASTSRTPNLDEGANPPGGAVDHIDAQAFPTGGE